MAWFFNSWVPVAVYMVATMVVSFLVARTVHETVNRDLQILTDAEELRTYKVATLQS